MRLKEIEITPCVLKLRQPVQNASTAFHERHSLLIRLVAEDGRCGRGEVTPLPEFGTESLGPSQLSLELAAKRLRDRELPASAQEVDQLLAEIGDWTSRPAARFGLELGLLDLASQSANLRLSRFLNPSAITSVEVNALLTGSEPEELAQEASAAVREGYRVLKVKVAGRALADDARRLFAVRRQVGERIKIRVDANGQWSEAEAAIALRGFSPLKLELCEQPVAASNHAALRRLRWLVPCAIAADEALGEKGAVDALLDAEDGPIASILVLKPTVLGGMLPALRIAQRAERIGVGTYVTSALDGVVARLGAAHLAAALPSNGWASGLGVGQLFANGLDADPYAPKGGRIQLSDQPGLGLGANWSQAAT